MWNGKRQKVSLKVGGQGGGAAPAHKGQEDSAVQKRRPQICTAARAERGGMLEPLEKDRLFPL